MSHSLHCWAFGRHICENKITKTEDPPFVEFKYLEKTNYTVTYSQNILFKVNVGQILKFKILKNKSPYE